ncbi:MAG: hypothetical protein GPI96_01070 [Microcystis aeruginosa BS13-02]|jgi:hypothetical protein|nr:hypothetical protein [Microcystis aeruginosa BS13-02]
MKIECDGFEFDFPNALDVFIFDEKETNKLHYHGLSHAMKAVDIIVELTDFYLFIEVKNFHKPEQYQDSSYFNNLRETLKHKYRDSWLYRWCKNKIDKPIKYLCLLELDTPLLSRMNKELRQQIPIGQKGKRWSQEICNSCIVLNFAIWNQQFTAWPIIRLS